MQKITPFIWFDDNAEYEFRYNTRELDDCQMFMSRFKLVNGQLVS